MVTVGGTDVNREFLDRVQREFTPERMTVGNLEEWLFSSDKRAPHKVKWGKDKKGKQRYKEVEGTSISHGTRRLASKLSETEELYSKAEVSKDFRELEEIKTEARGLPVHSSTVVQSVEDRIDIVRKEELKRKGKITTLYRDKLKRATTKAEIDDILSESLGELGEGKNFRSLEEAGDTLKHRIK